MLFFNKNRDVINQDLGGGKLPQPQVAKEAKRRYQSLDLYDRWDLEKTHDEAKTIYQRQLAELKEQGFFTLKDGKTSLEVFQMIKNDPKKRLIICKKY